jgi:hypothetical protein
MTPRYLIYAYADEAVRDPYDPQVSYICILIFIYIYLVYVYIYGVIYIHIYYAFVSRMCLALKVLKVCV